MQLRTLALAAGLSLSALAAQAAPGDVVFSTGFFKTVTTVGSFSDTLTWATLSAGTYQWEAGVLSTGGVTFSNVLFNGVELLGGNKFRVGTGATAGPLTFEIGGLSTQVGTYAGSLTVTEAAPIPEPGTYALMMAGLGAVVFLSRRRRNH